MARFDVVLAALTLGQSVRRGEWEPIVRMFILKDLLMCQSGEGTPWVYFLSWDELTANDWELVEITSAAKQAAPLFHPLQKLLQAPVLVLHDSLKEKKASEKPLLFFFRTRGLAGSIKKRLWKRLG